MQSAPRTIQTLGRVANLIQAIHDRMMSLDPRHTDDYFTKMIMLATRAQRLNVYGITLGEELGVFE